MTGAVGERYERLGSFDAWAAVLVDPTRWQRIEALVDELRTTDDHSWSEGPLLASSYQSGAIEGLHAGDRGVTDTLLDAAPGWEREVNDHEERDTDAAAHVEAGRDALRMALDVATGAEVVTEAWLRRVHEVACRAQDTYLATTVVGPQRVPLPKGVYKTNDNHVITPSGRRHLYAPVLDTPAEMGGLVATLRSAPFDGAPVATQAAFAHHGLTHIHPFADGNGRVARVLASVYLLRATSLPFFLFSDTKVRYFDALLAADRGDVAAFVHLVLNTTEDFAGIVAQRRRAALVRSSGSDARSEALGRWVDAVRAANRFADAIADSRDAALARWELSGDRTVPGLVDRVGFQNLNPFASKVVPGDVPTFSERVITVEVRFGDDDVISEQITVTLDRAALHDRPLRARAAPSGLELTVRVDQISPTVSMALTTRLDDWMNEVVAHLASRLDAALGIEPTGPV